MIIYVKKMEKVPFINKIFNILKIENIEGKNIIYLPINKKCTKRKLKRVIEKLNKYLYDNNIKNVVLEQDLMENEMVKNILYSNNINILDGTMIAKFLLYNVIKKVYQYKKTRIEVGEITILVNENDDINIENIKLIASKTKRLNIITKNTKRFRKITEYLYNELGILIKLSSNMKFNLNSSNIIVNIDFQEETVNKLNIPNNAVIINLPKNINITSKKFAGVNIKGWETEVPKQYKLEGFNDVVMYEASLYTKPVISIFNQIQDENIRIKRLIGKNGTINTQEFI